jgi:hypothetical protein
MASRGEVDGPRVAECALALSNWRLRTALIDFGYSEAEANRLVDSAPKTAGGPR